MFQPSVLAPIPDPVIVRDLHLIDPDLRLVWGFERYLRHRWTVERRMSPDRYRAAYKSLLESGDARFITQPIFDTNQPILDADGTIVGHVQVGSRPFDLAPEWEWVLTVEEPDGAYRPLDSRLIVELKRVYAWERFHSLTRRKIELQQAEEKAKQEQAARNADACMVEILDHKRELWNLPFSGQPVTAMPGTEL